MDKPEQVVNLLRHMEDKLLEQLRLQARWFRRVVSSDEPA